MRQKFRILLVVFLTIFSIFSGYVMADESARKNSEAVQQTTATVEAVTQKLDEKKLLVEDKKNDCHFYTREGSVILEYKGDVFEYSDWSRYIGVETPELVVKNFDDDPEKEIILKLVGEYNSDGSYVYHVYILNEDKDDDGNRIFHVSALTQNTFNFLVRSRIKIEVTQSPICDKIGYVALCRANEFMEYDRKTGIPLGYYYSFKVLQDKDGNYLEIEKWERGGGEYTVEEDGVYATLPLTIRYKGTTESQQVGFVKCMLVVQEGYTIGIQGRTMSFKANKEFGAYKPVYYNNSKWKSVVNNSSNAAGGDEIIDYIQFNTGFAADLDTVDFSTNSSDLNKLDKIEANQGEIKLYAKKGYTFSESIVKKKQYSLNLSLYINESEQNFYDIAYTATIDTDRDGRQVLTIKFDNKYEQEYMNNITINFGVK